MKIALVFSGHIRSYKNVRDNIFNNLIKQLENNGHKCYIFSSIWSNSGFRENQWTGDIDETTLKNDSEVIQIEKNKRKEFIEKYNNNKWQNYSHLSGPETCGDAISMWYRIFQGFNLINISNIDIVFRIRPDMYFNNKFNTDMLNNILNNTIYMPSWHGKYEVVTKQMMDHFAFGDYKSMKIYCSVYNDIDKIIERNDCPFTGEGFLYSQIKEYNLNLTRFDINYGVMRTYGLEQVS